MDIFCERLKKARNNKHLMQKDVADYLGMLTHAYQRYEYGEREPDFDKLVKICNLLDISADYLLGRTDNPDSHTITLEWQQDYNNTIGKLLKIAKDNPAFRERLEKILDNVANMISLPTE